MSLVPVEGVLQTVAKAQAVDAESTALLCRMTLFDLLTDMVDIARPSIERDIDEFIAKRADDVRRALVKEYVAKRLDGEDVEEVIKAAAEATLLEEFGKAQDDPRTKYFDARDIAGRFTRATAAAGEYKRPGYVDPIRNERYTALRETGSALQRLDSKNAKAVGAMAQAAGGFGPEAERVLGRGLRRTAYRYRGTERTANRQIVQDVKNTRVIADALVSGDKEKIDALGATLAGSQTRGQFAGRGARPGQEPFMAITQYHRGKKMSPDQYTLAVQGDMAAEYLRTKLPTPKQTAISMAAGRTPPSVGLLIDRDGDVVSEAQGFNGDHFLPFDLKNLKRMQGGQYVRTRAMGGPTVEDVYTGLLTGARQVQVVSNSGVFTMEFDPTIRGGRRYNDKATQMIRRYEALLGTIGSGQLMQQDIAPERKAELRQDAITEARGNSERARTIYDELLQEERGRQTFAMQEDDELEAQAVEEARAELGAGAGRAQIADLARDKYAFLRKEAKESRAKVFQLDADGYAAAMRSLQEEFPFYIRSVRTETLPEFVRNRGLTDPESADVPVHNPAADRGAIERGETNIEAKSKYGREQGLGRGVPRGGKEDKPSEDEASASATTGSSTSTSTTGAARPSQQPDQTGWRVPYQVAKDTKPLAKQADPSVPEIADQVDVGLERITGFFNSMGGQAVNDQIANGLATRTVALGASSSFDFVNWLQRKGGAKEIGLMSDAEKVKAAELLARVPKDAVNNFKATTQPLPDDIKSLEDDLKPVTSLLDKMAPFGEAFDASKIADFNATKGKPFAFPEIVAAGDKGENYMAIKAIAARKLEHFSEFIEKDNLPTVINHLRSELKAVNDGDPAPAGQERRWRPERIKQELEAAHFAWALQHGRALADGGSGAVPFVKAASAPLWDAEELLAMFRAGPPVEAVRKALGRL